MGQGSGVGHLNKCVLITLSIYRSVCVRERENAAASAEVGRDFVF